jgi:hypothetical protein
VVKDGVVQKSRLASGAYRGATRGVAMSSIDAASGRRAGRQPGGFSMSGFNVRTPKKVKSGNRLSGC